MVTSLGRNRSGKEKGEPDNDPDNSKDSAHQKTEADREDIRTLLDWGKGLKTPSRLTAPGKREIEVTGKYENFNSFSKLIAHVSPESGLVLLRMREWAPLA